MRCDFYDVGHTTLHWPILPVRSALRHPHIATNIAKLPELLGSPSVPIGFVPQKEPQDKRIEGASLHRRRMENRAWADPNKRRVRGHSGLSVFDHEAFRGVALRALERPFVVIRLRGLNPRQQHRSTAYAARRSHDRIRIGRGRLVNGHGGSLSGGSTTTLSHQRLAQRRCR